MSKPLKISPKQKKIVIRSSRKQRIKGKTKSFLRKYKLQVSFFTLGVLILIALGIGFYEPTMEETMGRGETLESVPKKKVEIISDFDYPEIIPTNIQGATYEHEKEIIEKDYPVERFLRFMGAKKEVSIKLASKAKHLGLSKFETSKTFYQFSAVADAEVEDFYVYEISSDSFAIFSLYPEPTVDIESIEVAIVLNSIADVVADSFFWQSFLENGGDYKLIPQLMNAFKWQIDYYHMYPNDRYKLVYEEKRHHGEKVGIGNLLAAYIKHGREEFYAFRFKEGEKIVYVDEFGRSVKKRFLKSPVEYNIINSPFNPNRFHPIHKEVMPHLGTDYFARLNDPVFAVGDGKVTIAATKKGNGNYVKIRHDETYETQYLHLNTFAEGIKPGKRVKQGEIIGYAGKTGYATGVHVCFRFWVDGEQKDYTKAKIIEGGAPAKQLDDLLEFEAFKGEMMMMFEDL